MSLASTIPPASNATYPSADPVDSAQHTTTTASPVEHVERPSHAHQITQHPPVSSPYPNANIAAQRTANAACPDSGTSPAPVPAATEHVDKPSEARQITQHPPVCLPYPIADTAQNTATAASGTSPAPVPAVAEHVDKPSEARQITQHPPLALNIVPSANPRAESRVVSNLNSDTTVADGGGRGRIGSVTAVLYDSPVALMRPRLPSRAAVALPPSCNSESQQPSGGGGASATAAPAPAPAPAPADGGLAAIPDGCGGDTIAHSERMRDGPPLLLPAAMDSGLELGHWELASGGPGSSGDSEPSLCGTESTSASGLTGGQLQPRAAGGAVTVLPVEASLVVV